MNHFSILGSHPLLSKAEFCASHPSEDVQMIGTALLAQSDDWNGAERMNSLGGTVKLGDIVATLPTAKFDSSQLADIIEQIPRKERVLFGLSVFGSKRLKSDLLGKALKRELKSRGRSARWVTSKDEKILSPAAVAKMKLTTEGYDFILIADGEIIHVGLTTHVQDADAWSHRDYDRPARSARLGMLPPKLARMMVNLATLPADGTLLDPFCGSGTILMETELATDAKKIIGSDNDKNQVSASEKNTKWLIQEKIADPESGSKIEIFLSDVRHLNKKKLGPVDAIVTEGHLGPPLKGDESETMLEKNAEEITSLWQDALPIFHSLLQKDGKLVCVWPSFQTKNGHAFVNLSKDLFVQKHFTILPDSPLQYHREGQFVTRNIFILQKK
ncbi:MAG: hypothetical protein NUV81_00205 [bacterium]|nr:hypothetical protein [bacterium]